MTETVDTWVMKSVKPPRSGWYMTWSSEKPDVVTARYYSTGDTLNHWGWITPLRDEQNTPDDFDMWPRQPIPPDVQSYHQLRAILAAKSNCECHVDEHISSIGYTRHIKY